MGVGDGEDTIGVGEEVIAKVDADSVETLNVPESIT